MFHITKSKTLCFTMLFGVHVFAQNMSPTDTAALRKIAKEATERYLKQQADIKAFVQKNNVRVEFSDSKGKQLYIHHIDPKGYPVYYSTRNNLGSATTIKATRLWNNGGLNLNLEGQNMQVNANRARLGIWEPGIVRTSHQEFGGRITMRDNTTFSGDNANNKHATHVAGTMVASGVDANAKGIAPQAIMDGYDSNQDVAEMATAASEGMLVSNHSYGVDFSQIPAGEKSLKRGYYDDEAQSWDNICVAAPYYLPVQAAGNDRDDNASDMTYDLLLGSSTAKNTLGIGAVHILSSAYTQPSDLTIAGFSNYGPTDDGRIKPDLVTPGVGIYSCISSGDDQYGPEDGTSMAGPAAAAALFLVQQHHKNTHNGNFLRADVLKGIAIHTAEEAGANPGPDYAFGWGLLNVEKCVQLISNTNSNQYYGQESVANGATFTKSIQVPGGQPLKVTIAWIDPAANPLSATDPGTVNNRTSRLVNDLDLRILNASETTLSDLPWKLDPANPSNAATKGDNTVDNVEQIEISSLAAGTYTIQVTHKGTLANTQAFALVVTGISSPTLSSPNVAVHSAKTMVFPNPASEEVRLVYYGNEGSIAVLNDMYGKKVSQATMAFGGTGYEAAFDLKNLPAGSYFIYIEGTKEVLKVLKK